MNRMEIKAWSGVETAQKSSGMADFAGIFRYGAGSSGSEKALKIERSAFKSSMEAAFNGVSETRFKGNSSGTAFKISAALAIRFFTYPALS